MTFNLFKKNKKDSGEKKEGQNKEKGALETGDKLSENVSTGGSGSFSGNIGLGAHRILVGFFVSEKASTSSAVNQYVFRVRRNANKPEIKKEVAKLFNVKVKSVKVLNMPEKRRDFGKHPGAKSGFKKAVVVLEKGYVIGQAKP